MSTPNCPEATPSWGSWRLVVRTLMTTWELVKAQSGLPPELESSPHHTMDPITLPRPQWKCHKKKHLNRACG